MSIRAGAAAVDITPAGPVALAGYGNGLRMASAIRDRLYASAVHLRGGSGGIVILSLDLHTLTPSLARHIREQIHQATGLPHAHILIGTTQTHSGPVVASAWHHFGEPCYAAPDAQYLAFITEKAVEAASEAAVASQPAAVAALSLGGQHTGALLVRDSKRNRIASVVIIHETMPNRLGSTDTRVSSDIVDALRNKLGARFGGTPVVAYLPSSTGDQRLEQPELAVGETELVRCGTGLADLIVSGIRRMKGSDFHQDIAFSGRLEEIWDLPLKQVVTETEATTQANLAQASYEQAQAGTDPVARLLARWHLRDACEQLALTRACNAGHYAKLAEDYRSTDIQLLRVGSTRLLCLPGAVLPDCIGMLTRNAREPILAAEGLNGDMLGSVLSASDAPDGTFTLLGPLLREQAGETIATYAREFLEAP